MKIYAERLNISDILIYSWLLVMYYNLHSLAAEVRRVKMARPVPQI